MKSFLIAFSLFGTFPNWKKNSPLLKAEKELSFPFLWKFLIICLLWSFLFLVKPNFLAVCFDIFFSCFNTFFSCALSFSQLKIVLFFEKLFLRAVCYFLIKMFLLNCSLLPQMDFYSKRHVCLELLKTDALEIRDFLSEDNFSFSRLFLNSTSNKNDSKLKLYSNYRLSF